MRTRSRLSALALSLITACSSGSDVIGLDGGGDTPDTGAADAGAMDASPIGAGRVLLRMPNVDLGLVVVGTTRRHALTITNPGAESVRVTLSEPEGAAAARFTRTINAALEGDAFVIPAGIAVDVELTASPTAPGPLEALLRLDSCNGACTSTIGLRATGALTGLVCPPEVAFPLTNPGACTNVEITCDNQGNVPEQVTAAELEPTSAPAFMAVERALPITFAPGASERFGVRFCPAAAGSFEGDFLVQSFMPAQVAHEIHLTGRAGGADVRCMPEAITFGSVGAGATVEQSVTCENRGSEPAPIRGRLEGAAFALTAQPTMDTPPGRSAVFTVAVRAMNPGTEMGQLHIATGDPDTPEVVVPISAEVIRIERCDARLSPSSRDFGLVPPGDRRTAAFTLTNTGATTCLVRAAALGPQSSPTFTIASGPQPGAAIAAGQSAEITVAFAPTAAANARGALVVSFSNPGTADATAELLGSGGTLPVSVQPPSVDFGAVTVGCGAPAVQRVVVRGLSNATNLSRALITGTGSAAFSLQALMVPQQIPPFAVVNVDVAFRPPSAGAFEAELHLELGMAGVTAIVPLRGQGTGDAMRTDRFTVPAPKLDVLFVVEDSRAAGPAQTALAAEIPGFLAYLRARTSDFHIGVITSDMDSATRSGRLLGQPAVLDAQTPMLEQVLRMRVQPGTGGSANEQPIQAVLSAVTPPLATGANNGFLRPGADLVVIFAGGEDDASPAMPSIESYLATIRRASGSGRLRLFGLIGPPASTCFGPNGPGAASPRLNEAIARNADGIAGSICETMARGVRRIVERVAEYPAFRLGSEPLPTTIRVRSNGQILADVDTMGARIWLFEPISRRVMFTPVLPPAAGRMLDIEYTAYCLSPTCGNGTVEMGEACDDGNANFGDMCTAGCRSAYCGDQRVLAGVEACDDGNLDDNDACVSCIAARCGDGILRAGSEDCDDGNTANGDGCPADCRLHEDVSTFYTVAGPVSETYTPLPMPTVLTMDADDGSTSFQLPYPFRFFGVATTTITVTPNGVASPGPLPSSSNYQNATFPNRAPPDGVMAVWWDDLMIDTGVSGGSDVSWQVLGTAPNRVTVIQWRNVRPVNHSRTNNRRFHFQLALAEGTNVIRYQYGETLTSGSPPTASSASVGLENADATAGQDLLGCAPGCEGPARPGRPNGYPASSAITLTPVP